MDNQLLERIKDSFRRIWEPSEIQFTVFTDAFFASIAVIVALRLVGYEGIAMTYFWVAAIVFAFCAIVTRLRIRMEPKDTRLETLITKIDTLTQKVEELKDGLRQDINSLRFTHAPYIRRSQRATRVRYPRRIIRRQHKRIA